MSCEWPVAACVSRSFQATGPAGPKVPSLPQLAPAARAWLTRASRLVWKSGRLQVAVSDALPAVDGAGAAGVALSPPPPQLASPTAAAPTTARLAARYHPCHCRRSVLLIAHKASPRAVNSGIQT